MSRSDIIFALHAFVLSSISLCQTYYYSRARREPRALKYQRIADEMMGVDTIGGDVELWMGKRGTRERTTAWTWASLLGISCALVVGLAAVTLGKWEWLDFIYLISYIKLYIRYVFPSHLPHISLHHSPHSTTQHRQMAPPTNTQHPPPLNDRFLNLRHHPRPHRLPHLPRRTRPLLPPRT